MDWNQRDVKHVDFQAISKDLALVDITHVDLEWKHQRSSQKKLTCSACRNFYTVMALWVDAIVGRHGAALFTIALKKTIMKSLLTKIIPAGSNFWIWIKS